MRAPGHHVFKSANGGQISPPPRNLTALFKLVADGIAKDVPADIRNHGVLAAVNAYRGNVRKQNKARDEARAIHAFQLHPRRLSTTKVVRCTFRATQKTIKSIARPDHHSRSVLLDFAFHAKSQHIRALGAVRVREGALGDLDGKVNFVRNSTEFKAQKEDVTFEFDTRTRRWYASFLYDAPKTPEKALGECQDIAALDLGIRTPATVVGLTNGDVCVPYRTNFRDEIQNDGGEWKMCSDESAREVLRDENILAPASISDAIRNNTRPPREG